MQAIPKGLLIHTVMHYKQVEEDRWGNGSLNKGTELSFVRMEPANKIVRNKNNAEIQLAATLFYDCRNSRPRGQSFTVDDIIVFNGMKYKIQTVDPLYDNKRLHHYEIGLIKGV